MAFRLQSAIAGFAKRTSEKMEKFDDTYFETLRNSTQDLAKEAQQIRKDRTASVRQYRQYGQRLRDLGLSDGQIQTVLASGVDRYDEFVNSLNNQQQIHVLSNKPGDFDRRAAAQSMFQGDIAGDILSLEDQASAFAAQQVPSTLDLEATAASIAAGTQRGIFKMDPADVRASLGTVGSDIQAPSPMFTDTGLSLPNLGEMTADEIVAARQAAAELESTQASTQREKALTQVAEAQVKAAEITNRNLPEKLQVELDGMYSANALRDQQIYTSSVQADTAILEQEKLAEEIELLEKYGADEKEKALDLLDARIAAATSPKDLEQLMSIYMQDADRLTQEAMTMEDGPDKIGKLEQAGMLRLRIGGLQNTITDMDSSSATASLKNPENRFNALLKTNLQNQNIMGQYDPATQQYRYDYSNKRPAYITGFSNSVNQFQGLYAGTSVLGLRATNEYQQQLENQISNWFQSGDFGENVVGDSENDFVVADFLTGDEDKIKEIKAARIVPEKGTVPTRNFNFGVQDRATIKRLRTSGVLMAGDIVQERDPDTGRVIRSMYGADGNWIAGGLF